jgi:hypothetical protein
MREDDNAQPWAFGRDLQHRRSGERRVHRRARKATATYPERALQEKAYRKSQSGPFASLWALFTIHQ